MLVVFGPFTHFWEGKCAAPCWHWWKHLPHRVTKVLEETGVQVLQQLPCSLDLAKFVDICASAGNAVAVVVSACAAVTAPCGCYGNLYLRALSAAGNKIQTYFPFVVALRYKTETTRYTLCFISCAVACRNVSEQSFMMLTTFPTY
jgi:hypothetical protein